MPLRSTQFEVAVPASSPRRQSWLWFNLLSLDAPLVAVAWQVFIAASFHISLSPVAVLALGLTVWLIYATDRLLDVRQPHAPATERHRFHRQHFALLAGAACTAFALLILLAFLLRPILLRDGLILSGLVAAYFAVVHLLGPEAQQFCPKELAVGFVFAAGTCLAPWTRLASHSALIMPALLFGALCSLNCVGIEVWEWTRAGCQQADRPHPLTLWLAHRIPTLCGLIAVTAAGCFFALGASPLFAAITLSSIAFAWLDRERHQLSDDALRVLADLPLLSPLLLMAIR